MALAFGLTLRELALLGTSKWVQAFLTALFALSPVNNTMVITLWKDIPYAIALLFLFWALLRVWRTDGAWLRSRRALASIGVALAALALYRHNGAPTALLILPASLIVGRRAHWRQIAGMGGIALALVLLVKVGVYRALDVAPAPPWFVRQSLIHQIGAFLTDPDARISEDDRRHIERLGGGNDEWRRMYSCYQLNSLLYGGAFDYDYFDAHVSAVAAQSMVWMLLLTVQDFRFQYPVYVVSLMMVGLLFVPSMRHSPEPETKGDHRQATGAV